MPPLPRLLRFATAVVLPVLKLNPVKGLAQEPSAIDKVIADAGVSHAVRNAGGRVQGIVLLRDDCFLADQRQLLADLHNTARRWRWRDIVEFWRHDSALRLDVGTHPEDLGVGHVFVGRGLGRAAGIIAARAFQA